MAPTPKKHYLPFLLLLPLSLLLFLSHYSLTPPLPSSPDPTITSPHFLSPPRHHHNFTLTLKVLAYNRLASLKRCLNSLSSAHYSSDPINLHIYIDHFPNSTFSSDVGQNLLTFKSILGFVDGFEWPHGVKMVHYRSINVGLQAQWIEAWWPTSDDEFVFVVEDDVEVSKLYYQLLKKLIMSYYYDQRNFSPFVYGASLQRPRFVPGKHGNKMNLSSETKVFLYQVVGTWGQLLFPRPWKEFRLWYDDHKARGIKPFLEGMVTNGWYKKMGEKIWTPWFFKFIHSRGYFNIYTNFLHERALSVSHRDAGVNYGKTAGPDSQLIDENYRDIDLLDMQPLSDMQWYDFCFRKVLPGRVAKKLDEVGLILQTMEKQKPVLLVSLLEISEHIVRNLICHFERLDIRNYIFMAPHSRVDFLLDLARRGHPVIDTGLVFDSIMSSKSSSPELIRDIVVKAYVIKKCLESGFGSWVISGNMLPMSNKPLEDSSDSNDDFYIGKDSRFLVARSSSSSRRLWDESFVRKMAAAVNSLVNPDSSLEGRTFADAVEKKHGLEFKIIDDTGTSLKLERVDVNQSLPENTKMIYWSPATEVDSVVNHLQGTGLWIIDAEWSCKSVICHRS